MGNGSSSSSEYRIIQVEPNNEPQESPFPRNKITSSKYTLWNFVPKNLFEQFRRIGNLYFLLTVIISMSIESPISPLTSALPLLFVILVTACKQGFEDLLRYRSDRRVNSVPVLVVRKGIAQEIACEEIVVGDVVRVNRDDEVPCDLVILHSSSSESRCYVTTSNLDGETNLKMLQVPKILADLEIERVVACRATITCQQPLASLYAFEGRIQASVADDRLGSRTAPLAIEHIALRGMRLRDTDFIVGCAVYTGRDTKLSLNSKLSVNKFSTAEKSINQYILVFILLLLLEVFVCTSLKVVAASGAKWNHYLGEDCNRMLSNLLNDSLSFFILFNYVVPISLYVTIELQQFLGSFFFGWDLQMYDATTEQPAVVNTSDLNEDLGQVEYLFSDKTGTLTENLMIFRRCFIDGHAYSENECNGNLYLLPANGQEVDGIRIDAWTPEIWHFMLSIALCHDVHVAPATQKVKAQMRRAEFRESFRLKKIVRVNSSLMMHPDLPEYEAASADEKALVEASARCGVVFLGGGEQGEIQVNAKGTMLSYERLDCLEFTSDRKRMSVVVRDAAGDVWLYCKGADSSVFPLIHHQGELDAAHAHVADFSKRGLRTLLVGYKKLTQEQYDSHFRDVDQARQTMSKERAKYVERAYDRLENGLTLLGVSAVEDRLQEGVPETMEKLRAAGIKIWVLTGDKAETAENIAFFCGHFKKGTEVLRLMNMATPQLCFLALTSYERRMKIEPFAQYGLLMDGASMGVALKNCPSLLRNVAMACEAVVCCRMSPLQKSEMVQLVKRARGRPLTAAIGDGGNDVSMIKEAHVGLGIAGKEGRQAAMSADFALAKFMHLERALLVHGSWYYLRVAHLVQYFFYKNLVFITPQLLYSLYNGFSGQPLYDGVYLMCFNIFFSSVPVLVYGISEQNYADERLLRSPQLYQLHRKNYLLAPAQFLVWIFLAVWQICAIYFIPHLYWWYNPVNLYNYGPADLWCFSTCIFHLVTLVINLQLLVMSSYWTVPFVLSILATELFFFAFTLVYSFSNLHYDGDMHGVFPKLLASPTFWILTLLVVAVCMIPTLLIGIYNRNRPNRLKGKLEEREDSISEIIYSPVEASPAILPNRRSSTVVPWRGNFSFYDNHAF